MFKFNKLIVRSVQIRRNSQAATKLDDLLCEFQNAKPYSEIPGPKPFPILGNTWRFFPLIGRKVTEIAQIMSDHHKMYGDILAFKGLLNRPDMVFVYDADEIEKMFRQEGTTPVRLSLSCLEYYRNEIRKDIFGPAPGIVAVHGEPWREFRSKVQKPVLQPQTVRKYIGPIEEITDYFMQRMQEMKDDNEEMPADFANEIHKWSVECIARVSLDVRLGCLNPNLTEDSEPVKFIQAAKFAIRNIQKLDYKAPFYKYLPSKLFNDFVKNMDYSLAVCMKYIDEAMERLKTKTVTSENDLSLIERILLKEDHKTAVVFAYELIFAGIDTISMAVCSLLYQMATRPVEQEKLYQELKKVLPDPTQPLTVKKLDEMVYLKAFVKEVFRLYTPLVANGRVLQNDKVIMGYHIPRGVEIMIPTLTTGSMEKYVSNPDEFLPERWMKSKDREIHPFASLPYGYGARMCLGRRFADLEIQVLLAKLIRSYKLEYNHEPLNYKVMFMYAPVGDLKFKVTERTE